MLFSTLPRRGRREAIVWCDQEAGSTGSKWVQEVLLFYYVGRRCKGKSNSCVFPEGPEKAVWLTGGTYNRFSWAVKHIHETVTHRQNIPVTVLKFVWSTTVKECEGKTWRRAHLLSYIPKNCLSNLRPGTFHVCPRKRTAHWVLFDCGTQSTTFLVLNTMAYTMSPTSTAYSTSPYVYSTPECCDLVLYSLQYPEEMWLPAAKVPRVQCSIL